MDRRKFLILTGAGFFLASGLDKNSMAETIKPSSSPAAAAPGKKTRVSLVRTSDRKTGIPRAIELLNVNPVDGKDVFLKPNFNTADPFPASTHNDTLTYLVSTLSDMGAGGITMGERSGPPVTSSVIKQKNIPALCDELGVEFIDFEELPPDKWVRVRPEKSHWKDGFDMAGPLLSSECVVTTCCLKTHGFGGVFTMSLKLSVGATHKRHMKELHASQFHMRQMIAELNQAYSPSLILMDGIEVFTDGGPARGTIKKADVIIAGTDRVAVDAVGLSVLKDLGSNRMIMDRKIFEQEQIARAAELGLGVAGPEAIEIVTGDDTSRKHAERLTRILLKG
jgi:uncharacterized protein (DUF362 family)